MKIEQIDHLVLTVKDIKATCKFYASVLGMEIITFEHNRLALKFNNQKLNLHEIGNELTPQALKPTPGAIDLCLITKTPLAEAVKHLEANQVKIIAGPVNRTGVNGAIISIYIRDPDGNLIEVSNYTR